MQVELDYDLTEEIKKYIWRTHSQWGSEFHRSDLVYCELKPYCRLTGISARPRPRVVENWVVGEIGHILIQKAFKLVEVEREFEGAQVHYDVIFKSLPLEIKTSVLSILNQSHIPREYLDQIAYGLVFSNSTEGLLLTLDIVDKILLVWRVKLTHEELEYYKSSFIKRKERILTAVAESNPYLLEPKRDECDLCVYAYQNGCPWYTKQESKQ